MTNLWTVVDAELFHVWTEMYTLTHVIRVRREIINAQ